MNKTSTFNFMGQELRVVQIDGNPWFILQEVLECCALDAHHSTNHTRALGDDEKKVLQKGHIPNVFLNLFAGTASRVALIAEGGLYKLVMRSDKWEARAFQDWITKIVLPAIRKDGAYIKEAGITVKRDLCKDATGQRYASYYIPQEERRLLAHKFA